jgi:hypothetical protein
MFCILNLLIYIFVPKIENKLKDMFCLVKGANVAMFIDLLSYFANAVVDSIESSESVAVQLIMSKTLKWVR